MTGVQVYRPARRDEREDILAALAGLPPIGSRWTRKDRHGRLALSFEWTVVAHRDGKAIGIHTKHTKGCKCEGQERPLPTWRGSTWERLA